VAAGHSRDEEFYDRCQTYWATGKEEAAPMTMRDFEVKHWVIAAVIVLTAPGRIRLFVVVGDPETRRIFDRSSQM
jgi:hypothetical protein